MGTRFKSEAGSRPCAFLYGSDSETSYLISPDGELVRSGHTDIGQLRTHDMPPLDGLHVPKNYFRQARRHDFRDYRRLINFVTDADQNPMVLAAMAKALAGYDGRVLNHPSKVLLTTRERIAGRLADIPGVAVPRAVRIRPAKPSIVASAIERAGVTFPAILRVAGTHAGRSATLCARLEDVFASMEAGSRFVLTSFHDCRSPDGLYRKHRVFFVGARMILRHMLVSDHWNVHADARLSFMADRPDAMSEERAALAAGAAGLPDAAETALAEIRKRVGLDFFGLDCRIAPDGAVTLFEANATMNFFQFSDDTRFGYVANCLPEARSAYRALIGFDPERSASRRPETTSP